MPEFLTLPVLSDGRDISCLARGSEVMVRDHKGNDMLSEPLRAGESCAFTPGWTSEECVPGTDIPVETQWVLLQMPSHVEPTEFSSPRIEGEPETPALSEVPPPPRPSQWDRLLDDD